MSGIVGLFTNIRDLMKFSAAFRWGFIVLVFVLIMAGLSWFSPYEEDHRRDTPRSKPPLTEISIGRDEDGERIYARTLLGTTSQGQDVFWQLTFAVRNTFIIAGTAVFIGRSIAILLGMLTGYMGGVFDRVLSTIIDSLIVPAAPAAVDSDRCHSARRYFDTGAGRAAGHHGLGASFQALPRPGAQPARTRVLRTRRSFRE